MSASVLERSFTNSDLFEFYQWNDYLSSLERKKNEEEKKKNGQEVDEGVDTWSRQFEKGS